MVSLRVNITFPAPPPDSGGTSAASFPVVAEEYNTVWLEDEYPNVRVYVADRVVAVISGALYVHLSNPDAKKEPSDGDEA